MSSGHTHLLSLTQFRDETCKNPERKQCSELSEPPRPGRTQRVRQKKKKKIKRERIVIRTISLLSYKAGTDFRAAICWYINGLVMLGKSSSLCLDETLALNKAIHSKDGEWPTPCQISAPHQNQSISISKEKHAPASIDQQVHNNILSEVIPVPKCYIHSFRNIFIASLSEYNCYKTRRKANPPSG